MSGLGVAGFVIAIVLFFIAVLITRLIFGIGKILNLLTVIAQELRARNAVDKVDALTVYRPDPLDWDESLSRRRERP